MKNQTRAGASLLTGLGATVAAGDRAVSLSARRLRQAVEDIEDQAYAAGFAAAVSEVLGELDSEIRNGDYTVDSDGSWMSRDDVEYISTSLQRDFASR
jgi:hypothetical protein